MKIKLNKKNVRVVCVALAGLVLVGFLLHNAKVISDGRNGALVQNGGKDLPSVGKPKLDAANLINYENVEDKNNNNKNNNINSNALEKNVAKDVTPKGKGKVNEPVNIEDEFRKILGYAPIVVFSKTYCPFSIKLKKLLSEHYSFEPGFVVVELDEYPYGPQMQDYLGEKTQRRTVPNLLINGVSHGGFDDINALHNSKKLFNSLKEWCGDSVKVTSIEKPSNA